MFSDIGDGDRYVNDSRNLLIFPATEASQISLPILTTNPPSSFGSVRMSSSTFLPTFFDSVSASSPISSGAEALRAAHFRDRDAEGFVHVRGERPEDRVEVVDAMVVHQHLERAAREVGRLHLPRERLRDGDLRLLVDGGIRVELPQVARRRGARTAKRISSPRSSFAFAGEPAASMMARA